MFVTYTPNNNGNEKLFMGNASATTVAGKGKVVLKFTSGKELTLMDVLHVPEITKNLVFGFVLSKKGFKLIFESDKFVLTKGGPFVGNGYLSGGLFKFNVIADAIINKINKAFTYLLESSTLWHDRLGYVNFKSLIEWLILVCFLMMRMIILINMKHVLNQSLLASHINL